MDISSLGAWGALLTQQWNAPYFRQLLERVAAARAAGTVYPPAGQEFFALTATPPEQVRVVILGQDPYHEAGQAMGLAFSVARGVRLPPSLRNIFTELSTDLGITPPEHGDLTGWARQGVLLLNTVLTVADGQANSHAQWGWQRFTDAVLAATASLQQPIVYILWGAQAQKDGAARRTYRADLHSCRAAPQPTFCLPRLFRQPPFFPCQCFFGRVRCAADRVGQNLTAPVSCDILNWLCIELYRREVFLWRF